MAKSDNRGNHDDRDDWREAGSDEFDQEQLVTLEIEIVGAHVPTWRQVILPANYPLDELHFIIALLFDWSGECPYCFVCGPNVYEYPKADSVRLPLLRQSSTRRFDSTLGTVADVFPDVGAAADYYYDATEFARELWHLTIRQVGELLGAEYPFSMVPVCIDGEGNNPPEDVGGAAGYRDLCRDIADAGSSNHKSARLFLGLEDGEDYDPECFDLDGANYLLARDQVDAMENELVPNDLARLRELVKDMLAEEAVREASDILRMTYFAEQMGTPGGQRILQAILQEAFPGEDILADIDPASVGAPWSPGASGVAPWIGRETSVLNFKEEEPPTRGRIIPMKPAHAASATQQKPPAKPAVAHGGVSQGQPRTRDRVLQPNAYLDKFEERMKEDGLSEKTIKKHVANAEYFLNVYLPDNGLSVSEGCYRMDDYFGFYLPQNCPWMTLTSMKENIASIRKLYQFFVAEEVVGLRDRKFLEETIVEFKDEWLSGF